jgi:hypothetical protein
MFPTSFLSSLNFSRTGVLGDKEKLLFKKVDETAVSYLVTLERLAEDLVRVRLSLHHNERREGMGRVQQPTFHAVKSQSPEDEEGHDHLCKEQL